MLQAIVADQDLDFRMGFEERQSRLDPALAHEYRDARTAGEQQWLIANVARIGVGPDHAQATARAPVAAGDDAGAKAAIEQVLNQSDDDGGLSGAASDHIADDDYRHR